MNCSGSPLKAMRSRAVEMELRTVRPATNDRNELVRDKFMKEYHSLFPMPPISLSEKTPPSWKSTKP